MTSLERKFNSIEIDEKKLDEYVVHAKDACLYTGLAYFCSRHKSDEDFDRATFASFTLVPSPFPKNEFDFASKVQVHLQDLFHKCSNDHQFIYQSIKNLIGVDEFVSRLWSICDRVKKEGIVQPISLNIIRSDYFLDENKMKLTNGHKPPTALSQVEINTFGCGGCTIQTKLRELHKYMLHKTDNDDQIPNLPENDVYGNIVKGLLHAWRLYNNPNAHILLLVRDKKYTYGDHRLIEYKVFELEPKIKFLRFTFTDIHKQGRLDNEKKLFVGNDEVALVYFKSGFDPDDYPTEDEWNARLMIEQSMAIKGPRIEYHLMCLKKFQQYLYEKNTIERFIHDKAVVDSIRALFVEQFSFSKDEDNRALIEMCKKDYENYVLKPQLEGGGHNIFGEEVKNLLEKIENSPELYKYIVQQRIKPPIHYNYLVRRGQEIVKLRVNSEFGIFGVSIGDLSEELLYNQTAGYTYTTKDANSNESGIMAGFGAYDTCFLV